MEKHPWYKITPKLKGNPKYAELLIYKDVGGGFWRDGIKSEDVVNQLAQLDVDDIDLRINSRGGEVFEGFAIYNALKRHPAKIHGKVDGLAASVASVILMASDDIEMPGNAMIMIHDPAGGVFGKSTDMRKYADMLDDLKLSAVDIYHEKTKLPKEELESLMADETWLTAKKAIEKGFTNSVTESATMSADYGDLSVFKNAPACLLGKKEVAQEANQNPQEGEKPMEITLEMLKEKAPELLEQIKKTGADAERSRIQEVLEMAIPGHEKVIEKLAFDGVTTGPQAAMVILKAEKLTRETLLKNHDADAPPALKQPTPADDGKIPENLKGEARWQAEFEKSAKLQEEFGTVDIYIGAMKADLARGNR